MTLTESAEKRLREILKEGEYLEVGLTSGGCGGATIELIKRDSTNTDGLSIGGITNVKFADKTSQIYLTAGVIDYVEDMISASFVFKPPLGTESCGCGASIKL